MGNLLEPGHEYAGKTYGGEVADRTYDFFVGAQRNLELVPFGFLFVAVAGKHNRGLLVRNEVFAYNEVFGTD